MARRVARERCSLIDVECKGADMWGRCRKVQQAFERGAEILVAFAESPIDNVDVEGRKAGAPDRGDGVERCRVVALATESGKYMFLQRLDAE